MMELSDLPLIIVANINVLTISKLKNAVFLTSSQASNELAK